VIALTLSRYVLALLQERAGKRRFVQLIDRQFDACATLSATAAVDTRDLGVIVVMAGCCSARPSCSASRPSPNSHRRRIRVSCSISSGLSDATAQQMLAIRSRVRDRQTAARIRDDVPDHRPRHRFGGMLFKPWDQRSRGAHELQQCCRNVELDRRGQIFVFALPPLPGAQGARSRS